VWGLLKGVLPEFQLPLQDWQKALLEEERAKQEEQAANSQVGDSCRVEMSFVFNDIFNPDNIISQRSVYLAYALNK